MHKMLRLCTHWNLSVSLAVISCLFLRIPNNSMTLCPFRQLFLHSEIVKPCTDNMSHIQPYCPGTQVSGMYSILGWWQLFGYLCRLNTLIMEIVPSSHSAGTLQSVLAWHIVGRQDPLQRPSQLQKLLQKAHSQLIQLVAELVKTPLGWYVILLWHHRSLPADTTLMSWDLQTCCLVFMHDSSLAT